MSQARFRFGAHRLGLVAALVVGVFAALVAGGSAQAGGGNSGNAHLCQHDGWRTLTRTDGTLFSNQSDCVSYGAQGGTLVPFTGCFVIDTSAPGNYSSNTLQLVANAASRGDILDVQGVCVGSSTIGTNLTIDGAAASGYAGPALEGAPGPTPNGVLTVDIGTTVRIDGLTISDGLTPSAGAGIDNKGSLTLDSSVVTDNNGAPGPSPSPGLGSGIWNDGTLVLDDTTVNDNSNNQVGGGIMNESGTLTLEDSTVSDNSTPGNGGGIENLTSATLDGATTVTGNTAFTGGGIDNTFASASTLTLNDTSTVTANTARFGGGIYNAANGLGATANVTLNDSSTVSGNIAETMEGFPGGYGAGIFNEANSGGSATVTLNDTSSVTGNTALPTGSVGGIGGGLDNLPESASSTTTVTMTGSSTITSNTALHGGGILNNPSGVLNNCVAGVNVTGNTPDDIE